MALQNDSKICGKDVRFNSSITIFLQSPGLVIDNRIQAKLMDLDTTFTDGCLNEQAFSLEMAKWSSPFIVNSFKSEVQVIR